MRINHIHIVFDFAGLNIFSQGFWKEIKERAESSGSPRLFEVLKKTVLAAKATGTVVNYTNSLNRWINFANEKYLVNVFPVTVVDVALYFCHLSDSHVSASVIETSYCALKWVHDISGAPNPMNSPFVKNIIEGAKRQNAKPVVKKSPISKGALIACCTKYEHSSEF